MISSKDLKRILRAPLFGGCDPVRLSAVCEACGCEVREFAAGEVVLSPETETRAACLLLSGRAVAQTPDPGRSTLLRYLSENEPFGIANLFEFYEKLQRLAPDLSIMGIVVTKANERKNQFKQAMEVLGGLDNVRLFETYIRIDSTIEWSQENSLPVMAYKKSSRAAQEYLELSKEVMNYAHR